MKYNIISADSHNLPAPDLFERHMPVALRDRAPRLVDLENGGQGWEIEDVGEPTALGATSVNYRAQKRYDRAGYRSKFMEYRDGYTNKGVRYDDLLPGAFDPDARLKEQGEDGVDAEIIYPDPPFWSGIKAIQDLKLRRACFQAYNDWAAEFDSRNPARLITSGLLPTTGVDDAIAEMKRCIEQLGRRSVTLESYPNGSLFETAPEDDRFWAEAEAMGTIVNIHANFGFPPLNSKLFAEGKLSQVKTLELASFQAILNRLILEGVFERFPRLTLIGAEVQCGWIPYYFEQFDGSFRRYHKQLGMKLDLLPSEYFRRNVKVTYILDQVGVDNRYLVGVENMMWSSDYPHSVSNFPLDAQLANSQLALANATPSERERILWRTCAETYKLDYEE